jgi:hypothetical protein
MKILKKETLRQIKAFYHTTILRLSYPFRQARHVFSSQWPLELINFGLLMVQFWICKNEDFLVICAFGALVGSLAGNMRVSSKKDVRVAVLILNLALVGKNMQIGGGDIVGSETMRFLVPRLYAWCKGSCLFQK